MNTVTKSEVLGKARGGGFAGLVGGFALFSSFMGIDSQLGIESGTFYKMIGLTVDLDGMSAITFGFFAHLLTAALIGSVFYVISSLHRTLNLVTVPKGILAGGVTGLVVFGLFFMPIHTMIMVPVLESTLAQSGIGEMSAFSESLEKLVASTEDILWGSLVLHVLYGAIMGLFCGMMAHEEYNKLTRIKKFF